MQVGDNLGGASRWVDARYALNNTFQWNGVCQASSEYVWNVIKDEFIEVDIFIKV